MGRYNPTVGYCQGEEGGGQWVGTTLLWGTVRVRGKGERAVGRYSPTVGYCQGERQGREGSG